MIQKRAFQIRLNSQGKMICNKSTTFITLLKIFWALNIYRIWWEDKIKMDCCMSNLALTISKTIYLIVLGINMDQYMIQMLWITLLINQGKTWIFRCQHLIKMSMRYRIRNKKISNKIYKIWHRRTLIIQFSSILIRIINMMIKVRNEH